MYKNKKIKINGESIYLKSLDIDNATEEYASWLNDKEVNHYLETRVATREDLEKYIEEKNKSDEALFLGIFSIDTDEHIGNIKLEPIDFEKKQGTIGILIGNKKYWGKGVGTEATKLLVDYAFRELSLEEVNLGVILENKAAIRVYEKVGFEIVNIEKKSIRHGDEFFDKAVMVIKK